MTTVSGGEARRERFDAFVERALYGPDGFFTAGRGAGRRADFLTSPEVGPLFGAVVARWVGDAPVVVEAGAGRGALAIAARAAGYGGRWVCVERAAALREEAAAAGFEAQADLPLPEEVPGAVVVANELLDNLPFRLLERTTGGWAEVEVEGGREVLGGEVAGPDVDAEPGARVPVQAAAAAWVAGARRLGPVLALDYADSTASLARRPWREWVRTYRGHRRGGHPVEAPGTQDVTCEVALDQLPLPAHDRSQAEWLRHHGLDDMVAEGRATWVARAAVADLDALRARSRATEAAALTDPAGLGAFRALEWDPAGSGRGIRRRATGSRGQNG